MKYIFTICLATLLFTSTSFSQAKNVTHKVDKGETIAQIALKYSVTPHDIYQLNPDSFYGLKPNSILLIPNKILKPVTETNSIEALPIKINTAIQTHKVEPTKNLNSLSKDNDNKTQKKLVLLLPFNVAKIEEDTTNSIVTRLKKDKFLNITLDFYSGALVAIDSAKRIGINIDVKIFDSQETKTNSNIPNLIQENHLEEADAIVGPFYQSNVEKTAEILGKYNVPVISPLSKDIGNSYSNLYQTIPTVEVNKKAMFDYMISKSGNSIAVIDKKKESVRQYIKENQKQIQFY